MILYTETEGGVFQYLLINITKDNLLKILERARKKQKKNWLPTIDALGDIVDENEQYTHTPVTIKIKDKTLIIASIRSGDGTYWNFLTGTSRSRSKIVEATWKPLWKRYMKRKNKTHAFIENGKLKFT